MAQERNLDTTQGNEITGGETDEYGIEEENHSPSEIYDVLNVFLSHYASRCHLRVKPNSEHPDWKPDEGEVTPYSLFNLEITRTARAKLDVLREDINRIQSFSDSLNILKEYFIPTPDIEHLDIPAKDLASYSIGIYLAHLYLVANGSINPKLFEIPLETSFTYTFIDYIDREDLDPKTVTNEVNNMVKHFNIFYSERTDKFHPENVKNNLANKILYYSNWFNDEIIGLDGIFDESRNSINVDQEKAAKLSEKLIEILSWDEFSNRGLEESGVKLPKIANYKFGRSDYTNQDLNRLLHKSIFISYLGLLKSISEITYYTSRLSLNKIDDLLDPIMDVIMTSHWDCKEEEIDPEIKAEIKLSMIGCLSAQLR